MQLIDTHCHIHDSEFMEKYDCSVQELLVGARKAGVSKLVCVGTDVRSSKEAVKFALAQENSFASVAIHPHEAGNRLIEQLERDIAELDKLISEQTNTNVVAIGECGLDYFYHDSVEVREAQKQLLRLHFRLALKYELPMIFHIRSSKKSDESMLGDAFSDFVKIYDEFSGIRGVVHSFSATKKELGVILERGLFVGVNGILTFTKDVEQLEAAKAVPLSSLVLETDAPFLTPTPFRGKMCRPEHIALTAQFLSELRGDKPEELAGKTTENAELLFGI